SPMIGADRELSGFILTFQNNSERIKAEQAKNKAFEQAFRLNEKLRKVNLEMEAKNLELAEAYEKLQNSQVQILQQEKMASIGQLAAGVAHEINNPMGFITSNLGTLGKYVERMTLFLEQQQAVICEKVASEEQQGIEVERKKLKIDYLLQDSRDLIGESLDGADRVKAIVQNLKTFSRLDQEQEQDADINQCLENTISIAWNELKYKVTLDKNFGSLPLLHCHPQKLNQVFLNLLVNSAQAIEEKGIIKIRTWHEQDNIFVENTGVGIPEENLHRIFEPFYTTKEVGKGTGLGMSISYEIIKEHGGEIGVVSTVGEGTIFTVRLPLNVRDKTLGEETDG
ncbi:MAG: peptidylprolyl isomerase, partial [Deltaproteobacteria bacterium]|nr:peptidylprolyl isomerase [Deltaproteobacteria bacterium]